MASLYLPTKASWNQHSNDGSQREVICVVLIPYAQYSFHSTKRSPVCASFGKGNRSLST